MGCLDFFEQLQDVTNTNLGFDGIPTFNSTYAWFNEQSERTPKNWNARMLLNSFEDDVNDFINHLKKYEKATPNQKAVLDPQTEEKRNKLLNAPDANQDKLEWLEQMSAEAIVEAFNKYNKQSSDCNKHTVDSYQSEMDAMEEEYPGLLEKIDKVYDSNISAKQIARASGIPREVIDKAMDLIEKTRRNASEVVPGIVVGFGDNIGMGAGKNSCLTSSDEIGSEQDEEGENDIPLNRPGYIIEDAETQAATAETDDWLRINGYDPLTLKKKKTK